VDTKGTHPDGPLHSWRNRITMRRRVYSGGNGQKLVELKAAPDHPGQTEILYTTNGSSPHLGGGTYEGPITLARGTAIVLACAKCGDIESEVLEVPIDWSDKGDTQEIDASRPAKWKRRHKYQITQESYDFLERLKRHDAGVSGLRLSVVGDRWAELNLDSQIELSALDLHPVVEMVRKLPGSGQLALEVEVVHFKSGQALLDWVKEVKTELTAGEVVQ